MIFDTHCHLIDDALINNIDSIIENAKKEGVEYFLVVGWDKESSINAVNIANKYKNVYAAVGFHPCNLDNLSDKDFEFTMMLSKSEKVVAIGEIGLDYYWEKDEKRKEKQKEFFIRQIEFANNNNLPIIVHNRDAFNDCLTILKENRPLHSGVVHCYSGSVENLKDIFNLNLYIGLDGPVTYKNAKTPKEVAINVPLNRLLLETDSPYLSPHPLRGIINEPKNTSIICSYIAELRGISKKEVEEATTENAFKLFGIKR